MTYSIQNESKPSFKTCCRVKAWVLWNITSEALVNMMHYRLGRTDPGGENAEGRIKIKSEENEELQEKYQKLGVFQKQMNNSWKYK